MFESLIDETLRVVSFNLLLVKVPAGVTTKFASSRALALGLLVTCDVETLCRDGGSSSANTEGSNWYIF
jgi:hypothetical protein